MNNEDRALIDKQCIEKLQGKIIQLEQQLKDVTNESQDYIEELKKESKTDKELLKVFARDCNNLNRENEALRADIRALEAHIEALEDK